MLIASPSKIKFAFLICGLIAMIAAIDVWNRSAMPVSVSPGRTRYLKKTGSGSGALSSTTFSSFCSSRITLPSGSFAPAAA
jgi:hypothetical protein